MAGCHFALQLPHSFRHGGVGDVLSRFEQTNSLGDVFPSRPEWVVNFLDMSAIWENVTHFSDLCVYVVYICHTFAQITQGPTPLTMLEALPLFSYILKMMGPREGYFLSSMANFGIYVQSQWFPPQKFKIKINMSTFQSRGHLFQTIILGSHFSFPGCKCKDLQVLCFPWNHFSSD